MITKLVVKYLNGKIVSSAKQKAGMTVNHGQSRQFIQMAHKSERLNIRRVTPFLNKITF
jgi:hypothetical protein